MFVGDLSPEVTDYTLQEFFRPYFPSTRSAKVVTEPLTGCSKGFGFVRFSDEAERDRAVESMNGQWLCGRMIRVSPAVPKKNDGARAGARAGAWGCQAVDSKVVCLL